MSDNVGTSTTIEAKPETLLERIEDDLGFHHHTEPAADLPPVEDDVGRPWWVTSDPNHPVNRARAEVEQTAVDAAKAAADEAIEKLRQDVENAHRATEGAQAKLADETKRANAAEAALAPYLVPEPVPMPPMPRPVAPPTFPPAPVISTAPADPADGANG